MHDRTAGWRPFLEYAPDGRGYDEMVSSGGGLRPHCTTLVKVLEALGAAEVSARLETARRTIRDHDVTYNVYGDPRGMDRPWQLDMVPLVLPQEPWTRIEAGLRQRARLLDLVLADIYGPQQLIRDRVLPAALIYANPGFLRPCHGIQVPGGRRLHLHASDLVRTPDGSWWVLADRSQAPSGAGYALENRIVLSRSLPEAFRDCQVERLASFFRAMREMLFALAPRATDAARVVLLTSGPFNETYFEHAYLARYLGLMLVEGGDLTVRDQSVFMKTVEGLQPVDVILRRLDDGFCDPLELRADSFLGCAGLVQAVRAGNVTVANALGSGALESGAMLPYLPRLCRHVLGEDLQLPSAPTWWCGQPTDQAYVLDHLDDLVIKPAFSRGNRKPIFGAALSANERDALRREIRARPIEFIAQERLVLSTAPVWSSGQVEPRALTVRVYAAAAEDGYVVMPGGLTRVAGSGGLSIVSMQSGGASKDTWVLADRPVSPATLLAPPSGSVILERAPKDLPSRVADNLFWLGRYAERCDFLVRVFRAVTARIADATSIRDTPQLDAMLQTIAAMELVPPDTATHLDVSLLEQRILSVMFVEEAPAGLRDSFNQLRRVAWLVRDRLSGDTWRILHQLHQDVQGEPVPQWSGDGLVVLNRMIMSLAAFSGIEAENMTRGHGWRFLDIGRRLERTVMLATVLRAAFSRPPASIPHLPHSAKPQSSEPATLLTSRPQNLDEAVLWPLLEIADSGMTYRRRYFAEASLAPVLDLIVADDSIPRSIAFQLHALAGHLDRLPRDPRAPRFTKEAILVGRLAAALRRADIPALCAARAAGKPEPLDALLTDTADGGERLSDTITHYYFSHAVPRVS